MTKMERNCLNCAFHKTDMQDLSLIVCWFNPPQVFFVGFDKLGNPGTVMMVPRVQKDFVCHNHLTEDENENRYAIRSEVVLK